MTPVDLVGMVEAGGVAPSGDLVGEGVTQWLAGRSRDRDERPEDVNASSGEGEDCLPVVFVFGAFPVVVGPRAGADAMAANADIQRNVAEPPVVPAGSAVIARYGAGVSATLW